MEITISTKHINFQAYIRPLVPADEQGNDLECVHSFEVEYPDLTRRFLPENLNIEFSPLSKSLYMSTGGQVVLPSLTGGSFQMTFVHPINKEDIKDLFSAYTEQIYELEDFFENGKSY